MSKDVIIMIYYTIYIPRTTHTVYFCSHKTSKPSFEVASTSLMTFFPPTTLTYDPAVPDLDTVKVNQHPKDLG